MGESQPKSVIINSLDRSGLEEWVGRYIHVPVSYNNDFYVMENISKRGELKVLYWYLDSKDQTKGSWRLANGNLRDLENSCEDMADPKSSDCGRGEQYLKYKIPVGNKFTNYEDEEAKAAWEN